MNVEQPPSNSTSGTMDDRLKEAFKSASDLAKQLLTLGTGILGVTVTFSKDLITRLPEDDRWRLEWSWVILALSLAAGLWALMALTGALGNREDVTDENLRVYMPSIRIPFMVQIVLFLLGLALLIYAGTGLIDVPTPQTPSST